MTQAIIIVGEKHAGKSTFGKMLAEEMGIPFGDTSDAIVEALAVFKRTVRGNQHRADDWVAALTKFKDFHRPELIAMGDAICHNDPTALIRKCCKDNPLTVVAGVRRIEELQAAKDAGMVKAVIYIHREGAGEGIDNFTIEPKDADITLANNGSLDALRDLSKFAAREID